VAPAPGREKTEADEVELVVTGLPSIGCETLSIRIPRGEFSRLLAYPGDTLAKVTVNLTWPEKRLA
jgi:hypothetical protein